MFVQKIDPRVFHSLFNLKSVYLISTFLFLSISSFSDSADIFQVTRVIDGDTVVIYYHGKEEKVRLIGVDTPETVHPNKPVEYFGKEASAFTKGMLSGKQVCLVFEGNRRDKYGRLLAYVHLPPDQVRDAPHCMVKLASGEIDFNASLISCGYAHAYTRFPFKRMEQYRSLERESRFSNRGLWKGGKSYEEMFDEAEREQKAQVEDYYVGSRKSDKYHRPGCKWAKKIKPGNLVKFKSKEEARNAGYVPCKVCKP